jgi:hypothetical protein
MSTTITPTEQNIEINVNNDVIDINVTNEIVDVNATTQQIDINVAGAYPIPNPVLSVFGRTGVVVATEGDYTLTQLGDVTLTSPSNGQVLKYNGTAWVNGTDAGGITTLNTLTALSQTFATGTSGTDFNISSATSTHTFNIPTASATNRGALSSADWTTFNSKQNALTNPITGTGTSGQVAYFNGTTSLTSSATFAFTPTSQLLVNNSVTAASAIARGTNLTPTLTAAANNDVLVGLDINPTFTNGAFTGVTNYALRTIGTLAVILPGFLNYGLTINSDASGHTYISKIGAGAQLVFDATQGINFRPSGNVGIGITSLAQAQTKLSVWTSIGTSPPALGSAGGSFSLLTGGTSGNFGLLAGVVNSTGNVWFQAQRVDATATAYNILLQPTAGNVLIGTTTDAGFRLDVNGTARVQNTLTVLGTDISGATLNINAINSISTPIFSVWNDGTALIRTSLATPIWNWSGTNVSQRIRTTQVGSVNNALINIENGQGGLNYSTSVVNSILAINNSLILQGTGSASLFTLNPTYNFNANVTSGAIVRGIYYNPTITTIQTATHRAIETVTGDVLLGTTSGNVAIGTSTLATATELTLGGSQTASSAIARGGLINTTLVAAANNDVLVGLDISPTFTNGAFTGVQNWGLRVQADALIQKSLTTRLTLNTTNVTSTNAIVFQSNGVSSGGIITTGSSFNYGTYATSQISINNGSGTGGVALRTNNSAPIRFYATNADSDFSTVQMQMFGATGNVLLQNGGTFTDAGYKLDVNGTARVQSTLTIGATAIISTEQAIISSNTSQQLRLFNTGTTAGTQAQLTFTTNLANTSSAIAAILLSAANQTLSFFTPNAGTIAEKLRIWNNGNVLIQNGGTFTDAGYRLDVNGTSRFTGQLDVFSGAVNFRVNNNSGYVQIGFGSTVFLNYSANEVYCGSQYAYFNSGVQFRFLGVGLFGNVGSPNTSAQLQADSTTKGFLPPRMTTTQKNAISSPATGLQVYDTTLNQMSYYNGTTWTNI